MRILSILVFTLICVAWHGCAKKEEEFPSETHEGRNICAFKIGDRIYKTQGTKQHGMGFNLQSYWADGYMYSSLYGSTDAKGFSEDESFFLALQLEKPELDSSFILHYRSTTKTNSARFDAPNDLYSSDSIHGGVVKITYLSDDVVSGTFDLTLKSELDGRIIHITEGRFDLVNDD